MSEIQGVPPADASPTKAIPLPLPSTPSPPHIPSLRILRSWLPIYLKKTDRTIAHLNRIFSTPSGTDTLLLTLSYSTLAASTLLSTISLKRLHTSVQKLISLATSLPENTTIILDASSIPSPRLLRLSQSLRALSDVIGDFRIFVRLWGLLGIWKWGRSLVDEPPEDALLKRIAWAEVGVNVAYQVLENGAYLASKGVLGWDAQKQNKAWLWSSRFWAGHVGLEFVRLAYLRSRKAKGKGKEKEGVVAAAAEEKRVWKRDLATNLAYAPLTVHWSRENGLVSDFWVGVLGTMAGVVGFTELWKNTA